MRVRALALVGLSVGAGLALLARARARATPIAVTKAVTINRAVDEVYAFWRGFENLPRFMTHLESVEATGERTSRWRARAPAGRTVEWDAETVEDRPGEVIAWRSLPGADVENTGSVRFRSAPGDRGTEVVVELEYAPPAGKLGATVAKLLGEEPSTQLADDLRRLKQVLETGEIARSDATPGGHALRGHLKRPARPLPAGDAR